MKVSEILSPTLKLLIYIFLFFFLTVTTQIGGVILVISNVISNRFKVAFRLKNLAFFISLYTISTFLIVPPLATKFGRQKIETSKNLSPATYMTILLNRNYVHPELNNLLRKISSKTPIRFLDANFPFIDKFPLLPHLSHNDGHKIDLSFIYETSDGRLTNQTKSTSGYGVFEEPNESEFDQPSECKRLGYFQYDYPKYLTFGKKNDQLKLSELATKELINRILNYDQIEKVFIEPHLVNRLGLKNNKIRFHGCRAVRHDDHIHIQIKKKN